MIVVTHEMAFAREAADRVYFMDEGQFVEIGPPEQVLENPKDERTRTFLQRFLQHGGATGGALAKAAVAIDDGHHRGRRGRLRTSPGSRRPGCAAEGLDLGQADDVAFGIGHEAERDAGRRAELGHDHPAAEIDGLGQGLVDIGHGDVARSRVRPSRRACRRHRS